MEGFRTFLESSTIHGLGYISTSRRLLKLFWILVVIAGFTGAGIMIYQSFDNWGDNPITTTIETHAIKDAKLPKVTVCPPKDTFTNLNFDLMMSKNMTFDNKTRDELTQYAVKLIQDNNFQEVMTNLSQIEEENRFYNWYNSYTKTNIPYWGPDTSASCTQDCTEVKLRYYIDTVATSGMISTKSFGERFNPNKILKKYFMGFNFGPVGQENNTNITLQFYTEKNVMKGKENYFGTLHWIHM